MDVHALLKRISAGRHYQGQIASVRTLAARTAIFAELAHPLPDLVRDALAASGITQFYAHQARAIDAVRAGSHVVIATGTASGKSLCYQVPVLAELLEVPTARALYLSPAKALAHDQLGALERWGSAGQLGAFLRPACYDGDTPTHKRPGIRRSANLLLSNPDMLHQSVLPYHAKWAPFFAELRYVILDEIHSYRGIFGSHVANVLRRLQRLCAHYGSAPRFICCSATLGNPRALAGQLIGSDELVLVDQDTSPCGPRTVVLWNPPWVDPKNPVARRSGNVEAQHLMQALIEEGAGTIAFTKARVVAELLYTYLVEALRRRRPDLAKRVRPYRGGYLPSERRAIEQQLFRGELLGVCSTNALELGIDVGALDAAIVVGFPGTLCSLWQQAGRAGRRQSDALVVFIAYDEPVDQYLMRHPDFMFAQPLEHAVIDPQNPQILAAQLRCAAFELPLTAEDLDRLGSTATAVAAALAEECELRYTAERYYWASPEFPARQTSLRTTSTATFSIVDATGGRNEVIGQVDSVSAPELIYPEAVYLHQGESFIVRELDWAARLARVERLNADYYTQPVLADECRILTERHVAELLGGQRYCGDVRVKWQTVAFQKFKLYTQEQIGQTALDLPAQEIHTVGVWLQPPPAACAATRDAGFKVHEGLNGLRNLLCVALPPLAMCDRYDIGGVVDTAQLGASTIILYDRYEGGVGYARHGFEHAHELLQLAWRLVRDCPCDRGCPACVGPPNLRIPIHHDPDLGHGYAIPEKAAVVALLSTWCEGPASAAPQVTPARQAFARA